MNLKTKTDTTPLSGHLVFRTTDISKIAPATKRISADHWRRILDEGPLSYQLNVAKLDDIQVSWMRCNRDMEINVPRQPSFYLLHFQKEGLSRYSGPGLDAVNTPGNAVILSPDQPFKIRHTAVTAFSITLSETLMTQTLNETLGYATEEKLLFHPNIDLASPVGRAIEGMFEFLIRDLDHPDSYMVATSSFQDQFAVNLAGLLINGLTHNHSSLLEHNKPTTGQGRVQMVESFIDNHLNETLTLENLARVACVSKRTLQKDFLRYRSSSPMVHLREKRLEAIHRELLNPSTTTTVTSVAQKFGITSPGRFSGLFKEHFGESPSQTLARGKAGQTTL